MARLVGWGVPGAPRGALGLGAPAEYSLPPLPSRANAAGFEGFAGFSIRPSLHGSSDCLQNVPNVLVHVAEINIPRLDEIKFQNS